MCFLDAVPTVKNRYRPKPKFTVGSGQVKTKTQPIVNFDPIVIPNPDSSVDDDQRSDVSSTDFDDIYRSSDDEFPLNTRARFCRGVKIVRNGFAKIIQKLCTITRNIKLKNNAQNAKSAVEAIGTNFHLDQLNYSTKEAKKKPETITLYDAAKLNV